MYVRTCQECGNKQAAKDPATYKDKDKEAWRDLKCRSCKSEALDYGSDGYHFVNGKLTREKNEDRNLNV
jgi:hypothetical protein